MYAASAAFHEAVRKHRPQKILLIFPETVFSNEDVDVNTGVEFHESFNMETDLSIGQALSGELNFALFNDYGDLNDYEFGEFTATLGVQIGAEEYEESGACSARYGNDLYVGHSSSPYLTKNGTAMANQPDFPVTSLIIQDGTVYGIGPEGQCRKWVNGSGSAYTLNAFMRRKMRRKQGMGFSYNSSARILVERDGVDEKQYEFVPLGVFQADRPNVPDVIRIAFTCNDRMMKLDEDMPTAEELGITYPVTIGALFAKICQHFEIPYVTAEFINSEAEIAKEPEAFEKATARTVIGWIAEAAGSNAMMNRDGKLEMRWVRNAGTQINESGYGKFEPYWYETSKVNKVVNRDTQGSEDKTHGDGENAYLIQDNPILKGFE